MTHPTMGRKEFAERLVALANVIPGYVLAKETMAMYEKLLVPKLGWDRLCKALEKILLERKARDPFPTPSDILAMFNPESDPETRAILASNLIAEAIAKDGHTNPDRARNRMGELGWAVVQMEGGWINLCQKLPAGDITHFRHQWTKTALAIQKAGPTRLRPAIEQRAPTPASEPKQLESFDGLLKKIASHDKG